MNLLTHILFCTLLSVSFATAQNKYRLEAVQEVVDTTLYIDFYIQKTSGEDFALGSSNFAVKVSYEYLDMTAKRIVPGTEGPFASVYDDDSYREMTLGGDKHINLTVYTNTSGKGNGQLVSTERKRVARVEIPIIDTCAKNTIEWIVGPAAINAFGKSAFSQDIKGDAEFVNPPPVSLGKSVIKPEIQVVKDLALCENATGVLQTLSTQFPIQWYYEGTVISGANTTSLSIGHEGYYKVAYEYCGNEQFSDSVFIQANEPVLPVIMENEGVLESTECNGIQWYLDGVAIDGATGCSYAPLQFGNYTVEVNDACSSRSEVYAYKTNAVHTNSANSFALSAFPSPYTEVTTLSFSLPKSQSVQMIFLDPLGNIVKTMDMYGAEGSNSVKFSAKEAGYGAGMYTVILRAGDYNEVIRIVEH